MDYAREKRVASDARATSNERPASSSHLKATRLAADAWRDGFELPKPGDHVGERYLIRRELGRGASGVVYDATHEMLDRAVAVKCLYPQLATNGDAVERFLRGARGAARVRHPNVAEVLDAGVDGELLYVAMERVDGQPLGGYVLKNALSIEDTIELFLPILDGVAAAHAMGVIHRDLKPENVLLVRNDDGTITPKLLDFGISKVREQNRPDLTRDGVVLGTPLYMAPEQVGSSHEADARADVYSIGVMLYEALTGRMPYEAESVERIFLLAMLGDAPPVHVLRPEVPTRLSDVIRRAMQPEAARRYESINELADALREAISAWSDETTQRAAGPSYPLWGTREGEEPTKVLLSPAPVVEARTDPGPMPKTEVMALEPLRPTRPRGLPSWAIAIAVGAAALSVGAMLGWAFG